MLNGFGNLWYFHSTLPLFGTSYIQLCFYPAVLSATFWNPKCIQIPAFRFDSTCSGTAHDMFLSTFLSQISLHEAGHARLTELKHHTSTGKGHNCKKHILTKRSSNFMNHYWIIQMKNCLNQKIFFFNPNPSICTCTYSVIDWHLVQGILQACVSCYLG